MIAALVGVALAMPPQSSFGVVEVDDVVVVRVLGDGLRYSLTSTVMDEAIGEILVDRQTPYDFAVVLHTERMPRPVSSPSAFVKIYNRPAMAGTGTSKVTTEDRNLRGYVWMNQVDKWTSQDPIVGQWLFGQEIGHYWLAHATFDVGNGSDNALLGRGKMHWSWFYDTPNSPLQGNRWIDNGDGSFTTDVAEPPAFGDLDLYLMGFLDAAEVAPFFYIEPTETIARDASSPAEWYDSGLPITLRADRVEVTVDDVIAQMGPRSPVVGDAPTDFALLTLLVLTPTEILTAETLDGVATLQRDWAQSWSDMTGGRSSVRFELVDEGRQIPPLANRPTLIPRGAW